MVKNFVPVVLAAGKGTRINARKVNKTALPLAGKPMIGYTVDLLKKVGFKQISVVVGFAKNSVINYLGRKNFIYVEQKKRLGTAHAVKTSLITLPKDTKNILVLNADDSAFYPVKVIKKMVACHLRNKNNITFLTVEQKKPKVGRILRDKKKKVLAVVEPTELKGKLKNIKEINAGCYCFQAGFLKKFLPKVKKNQIKKEYYLTDLIGLAVRYRRKIETVKLSKEEHFQSVNTKEELIKANRKMKNGLK